jgi:predicted nucleotidyltransferase
MTVRKSLRTNDSLISEIVTALRPFEPEKVILYGSSARGETDEYSDIDLVVIKRTEEPFLDRLSHAARLLSRLPKHVDLLVYTPDEIERMAEERRDFILTVLEEGRVIYESQGGG